MSASGASGSGELRVGMSIGESGTSGGFSSAMTLVTPLLSTSTLASLVVFCLFDFSPSPRFLLLLLDGVVKITSSLELPSLLSMIIVGER